MANLVPSTPPVGANAVTDITKQNIQASGLNVTFDLSWASTANASDTFVIEIFRADNSASLALINVPGNERSAILTFTKPEPGEFRLRLRITTIENDQTTSYVIIEDIVK